MALRHGLSATRIGKPTNRDRLLLVSAFAVALLALLGSVGESLGMDRLLYSNTSQNAHPFLVPPRMLFYELIANMPEHRLTPFMTAFEKAVSEASAFSKLLAHPV